MASSKNLPGVQESSGDILLGGDQGPRTVDWTTLRNIARITDTFSRNIVLAAYILGGCILLSTITLSAAILYR